MALGKPGRRPGSRRDRELNRQFHGTADRPRRANPALASSLLAVTHASVVNQNFHHYAPAALARSLAHHLEIVAAARAGDAGVGRDASCAAHLYNARATMLPAADLRRR